VVLEATGHKISQQLCRRQNEHELQWTNEMACEDCPQGYCRHLDYKVDSGLFHLAEATRCIVEEFSTEKSTYTRCRCGGGLWNSKTVNFTKNLGIRPTRVDCYKMFRVCGY